MKTITLSLLVLFSLNAFATESFNGSWVGSSLSTAVNYGPVTESYSAQDGFVVFDHKEKYFMISGCGFSISANHIFTCEEFYAEIKGAELFVDGKKVGTITETNFDVVISKNNVLSHLSGDLEGEKLNFNQKHSGPDWSISILADFDHVNN